MLPSLKMKTNEKKENKKEKKRKDIEKHNIKAISIQTVCVIWKIFLVEIQDKLYKISYMNSL